MVCHIRFNDYQNCFRPCGNLADSDPVIGVSIRIHSIAVIAFPVVIATPGFHAVFRFVVIPILAAATSSTPTRVPTIAVRSFVRIRIGIQIIAKVFIEGIKRFEIGTQAEWFVFDPIIKRIIDSSTETSAGATILFLEFVGRPR
jgi:hypothetical protein